MPAPTRHALANLDDVCDLVFTFNTPSCFGIVPDGDELTLRPGPHLNEVDDLIGFTAPVSWVGLAFVGTGIAARLDDGTTASTRITFALTRDGCHAGSVVTPDDTFRIGGPGLDPDRPSGHLVDLIHRSLQLPAAPEPSTPDHLDLAQWADAVLVAHDLLGPALDLDDWEGLISLHPRRGRSTARTWSEVHRGLVRLGCGWGAISADELAWMDPPTWARFVLAEAPRLDPLLAELGHRLSTSTMTRVHAMLPGVADSVRGGDPGGGV